MLDTLGWERDFHLQVVICSLGTCFCPHQQKEAGIQSWEVREGVLGLENQSKIISTWKSLCTLP